MLISTALSRRFLAGAVATIAATINCTETLPKTAVRLVVTGKSPVVALGAANNARDAIAFADVDEDGEEELIAKIEPDEYPRRHHVAAIKLTPSGGMMKWWSEPLMSAGQMLVGDIDDDPLAEIVLFREIPGREPELKIVQWDDGEVEVRDFALGGLLGFLADLDADDKDELVLVRIRVRKFDASEVSPANLLAYECRDGEFALTHKRELATGVAALTGVDLDGDGRHEVVTSETSFEGDVAGRLSVYRFEPDGRVSVAFRRNGVLEPVGFLRAFRSGGATYFLARGFNWQSVFRMWEESGAFHIAPVAADAAALPVFADANLATAAYSAERDMFFQFAEDDRTRLVPAARPGR